MTIPERFAPITGVLQSAEALEMLGFQYGKRRHKEGYTYVEGTFAPQYHVFEGLTLRTATSALLRGLKKAEKEFDIIIFPHIGIGREAEPDVGCEIARVALDYGGEVALDLVCDEAENPPEKHLPAYKLTFGSRVKRDCHAGEFARGRAGSQVRNRQLAENMITAIEVLKCHGIGHAIPLANCPDIIQLVVDRGVRVAGCPLSNVSEGHIKSVDELRINELLDAGVMYALSPDDDLFLPRMDEVLDECSAAYDFTPTQKRQLEANVFNGAFDKRIRT